MKYPWMPLYIAEYRNKTTHLSTAEHGAYLLLIMHYWGNGSLPDDDRQLARITAQSFASWRKMKPIIQNYFQKNWRHSRVEEELIQAAVKHERRVDAGKLGGNAKAVNKQCSSNATAKVEQSPIPSHLPSQLRKKDRSSLNAVSCETGVKTPAHGSRSADGRFVYFKRDTDEFAAYVNDYLEGTGDEPNATADGRWFKVYGEEQPVAKKEKGNGVSSELEATVKARGWA